MQRLEPLIVRQDVLSHPVTKRLSPMFKVRVASDVAADYIFPTFKLAFSLIDLTLPGYDSHITAFRNRIQQMAKSLKSLSTFALLIVSNEESLQLYQALQLAHAAPQPMFIPCVSALNAADSVTKAVRLSQAARAPSAAPAVPTEEEVLAGLLAEVPGLRKEDQRRLVRMFGSIDALLAGFDEASALLGADKAAALLDYLKQDRGIDQEEQR